MKLIRLALCGLLLAGASLTAAEIPSAADQIAAAVLAAPAQWRDGAAVLGYGPDGKLTELRKGSNHMVCLGDDPAKDKFSGACYHRELEPYMARGRELVAEGVTGGARNENHRWKEVADGVLTVPREPRMLYVLSGTSYDAAKGEVVDAHLRWVIYVPYMTEAQLGLPADPGPGVPWLMDGGTAGAHIMITPPRPKN